MNSYLTKLKSFLQTHKTFLISRAFLLLLVFLFIKVNRIEIKMNSDTDTFDKVTPVDYSVDRTRLICYSRRIPEEIQKTCDGAFPTDAGE
ncbi:hypothetical protein LEP1GSC062_4317 [Leptospira alexanderi serovar Manhao 3 str. L 60]|uniref:Uncharacterized protein n=1 Tax=Leptospira alexanderi serovar Manhao 3 str. L 60 TaxID=1049759 RepID=V6I6A0_9LEPT|nr:hypothetical protein LEP1GSC062_4317 [Leptospira alexanderi serovar Manhao 3 str. L 60]